MEEEKKLDTKALDLAAKIAGPTMFQKTKTDVDELFKCIDDDAGIITSNNINSKVCICLKSLKNKNTSNEAKIKLCSFLCDKLFNVFFLTLERREIIRKELCDIIYDNEFMPVPLRLWYLKFKNEQVSYETSINLFNCGLQDKMSTIPYFQILKYILRSGYKRHLVTQEVLDEFERLFANPEVSIYTKMEIADIFLLNNREIRGQEMLNTLRELEWRHALEEPEGLENATDTLRRNRLMTIYGDSQNVHNADVNISVLKACVALMLLHPPQALNTEEIGRVLCKRFPNYIKTIAEVLERIQIDESRFKYKTSRFGLYDFFSSLWQFIEKHPSKNELRERLIEEMGEMARYCTTGHLSRFINVIQGYTDNGELFVAISNKAQIKSVVIHYLDTLMLDAPESICDSMIEMDKNPFRQYILTKMNIRIGSIIEEYGNVQEHIINAVQLYSQWKYWSIIDNILSLDSKPILDDVKEDEVDIVDEKLEEELDISIPSTKLRMEEISNVKDKLHKPRRNCSIQ